MSASKRDSRLRNIAVRHLKAQQAKNTRKWIGDRDENGPFKKGEWDGRDTQGDLAAQPSLHSGVHCLHSGVQLSMPPRAPRGAATPRTL